MTPDLKSGAHVPLESNCGRIVVVQIKLIIANDVEVSDF